MGHDLSKLPNKLDEKTGVCRAVIETPKGRRGKYDYDPKSGLFRLKTLLPDGMSFPLDFGFIPSTLAEDGDPTDVMVLTDEPCPVGTLLDVRLLGVVEAGERTERAVRRAVVDKDGLPRLAQWIERRLQLVEEERDRPLLVVDWHDNGDHGG